MFFFTVKTFFRFFNFSRGCNNIGNPLKRPKKKYMRFPLKKLRSFLINKNLNPSSPKILDPNSEIWIRYTAGKSDFLQNCRVRILRDVLSVLWIRIRKFLGISDPDPSLFARIRILSLSSKKSKKKL
jgi:hypothetical protein